MTTILIVDDTVDGRLTLETLLAGQGYTLVLANSGADGLAKAVELIPDLILLDVVMPGMDGFEVCRQLRANALLAEVPIILITALDDRESRLQGIEAGADDFISKHFDPTELRARVRTTTRLNRYRRLLLERTKFERVVELLPNGLTVVDSEGVIRLANPALLHMLGRPPQEPIVGQHLQACIAPAQYEYCATQWHAAIDNVDYTVRFETVFVRLDGSVFPVEVDVGGVVWDDTSLAQLVVRDITDRKRLEAQLLQAQKMESLGRLAGEVAHDFNNLLAIILGNIDLATETSPDDDSWRGYLYEAKNIAHSATTLTRQLLTFSGNKRVEPSVVNLNQIIRQMHKLLRHLIDTDIELIIRAEPDLEQVRSDPVQIEQVLINMVMNARDAMPAGGKLTIETANVVLDQDQLRQLSDLSSGWYVLLSITDTGVGMNEDVKRQIFDPFFTTKEEGKGTGLGLAICYGIVKAGGGQIWVDSEMDKGTSFKIYLPCVPSAME